MGSRDKKNNNDISISLPYTFKRKNPRIQFDEIIVDRNKLKIGIRFSDFERGRLSYRAELVINHQVTSQNISCMIDNNGSGASGLEVPYDGGTATICVTAENIKQSIVFELMNAFEQKQQEQRVKRLLTDIFLREKDHYERQQNLSVYSALLLDITPAVQNIVGYCRYELAREGDEERILAVLNHYLGPNLSNLLHNKRFELTEQGLERKQGKLEANQEEQKNHPPVELSIDKLLDGIEDFDRKNQLFDIYESSYRVFCEMGTALYGIRTMLQEGKLDRDQLKQYEAQIREAYQKNGFMFRFYEDFREGSVEANNFIRGNEFDIDRPALYRNGEVYCNMDGSKR